MRGGELLDKMELADPAYVAAADGAPKLRKVPWKAWGAVAACLLLAVVSAVVFQAYHRPIAPIRQLPMMGTASDVPGGPRKFLNYNGCQYVFIENGSPFALTQAHLSKPLGQLEYDILADREGNSARDYAATFAVGGTIYRMTGYDPDFRIAVEFEGNYYICEKTGHTDGSALDPAALFQAADFKRTVTGIILYDHFGREELGRLSGKDAKRLIELLAQASPAFLTGEDYEAIGKAQKSGESFLAAFQLADTTRYKLYVIPSLSLTMIGNGRYTVPEEFHPAFDSVFDALGQAPVERIS